MEEHMEKDILTKVRKLNWVLQESASGVFSFNDLCQILSDLMDANVYIANRRGKVIGVHYKIKSDSSTITDPETGKRKIPERIQRSPAQGRGNRSEPEGGGSA